MQAAAPAKATTVAMPMAPPVGLTGAMTPMMRSRARREVCSKHTLARARFAGAPSYGHLPTRQDATHETRHTDSRKKIWTQINQALRFRLSAVSE